MLNAGIGTENTPVETAPLALWRWTFDVNVMGFVHGLQCCLPGMKARARTGKILITSSLAALVTPAGLVPYATSKAAAVALAETLRAELAATPLLPSVLIPAPVRTDFSATSNLHAPACWDPEEPERSLERVRSMLDGGLDPLDVGH